MGLASRCPGSRLSLGVRGGIGDLASCWGPVNGHWARLGRRGKRLSAHRRRVVFGRTADVRFCLVLLGEFKDDMYRGMSGLGCTQNTIYHYIALPYFGNTWCCVLTNGTIMLSANGHSYLLDRMTETNATVRTRLITYLPFFSPHRTAPHRIAQHQTAAAVAAARDLGDFHQSST